jgi:hypothetical protein
MQFKARAHVFNAPLASLTIVLHNQIEEFIQRSSLRSNSTEGTGRDFAQALSQETFGIVRAHRVGGLINGPTFGIVLDPPHPIPLIDTAGLRFPCH